MVIVLVGEMHMLLPVSHRLARFDSGFTNPRPVTPDSCNVETERATILSIQPSQIRVAGQNTYDKEQTH